MIAPRALRLAALATLLAFAGCGSLAPDKPVRPMLYDFGPVSAAIGAAAPTGTPLVLGEVDASSSLETTAMLYRLGYSDPFQLRPYAFARWSGQPAQLVRQRLREVLGRDRPVIDLGAAGALARPSGAAPRVLRMELEEFSHVFDTATESRGVVRLRGTVLENTPGGERLVGQRSFAADRPAPSADAPGGVRALTAATDAIAEDVARWLQQQR